MRGTRGITAGSAFATFEMRLAMIEIVDKAASIFPQVHPTLYVDDLSAEATGTEGDTEFDAAGFGMMACALFLPLR